MKKTILHTITVNQLQAKAQVQIRLPRNTKSVEAIRVTSDGFPRKPSRKQVVGWLWLRIPEQRHVFFAEVLKVPFQEYGAQLPGIEPLSFGQGTAWVDGSKEESFSIVVDRVSTLIEGYYSDELKGDMSGSYSVNIYLTVKL